LIDVSKEHVTSIFWVKAEAKQETSVKQQSEAVLIAFHRPP
jgi:hypothetical protein